MVTAVDAATGERTAFDDTSGVGLLDAVGASCAVPGIYPPVTIDGTRWIDGGVHSTANADLASGYGRVVVVAPMAASGGPIAGPRAQGERLVRGGARVCVITPDRAARSAFGRNVLDPAKRADAARAGQPAGGRACGGDPAGLVGLTGRSWYPWRPGPGRRGRTGTMGRWTKHPSRYPSPGPWTAAPPSCCRTSTGPAPGC